MDKYIRFVAEDVQKAKAFRPVEPFDAGRHPIRCVLRYFSNLSWQRISRYRRIVAHLKDGDGLTATFAFNCFQGDACAFGRFADIRTSQAVGVQQHIASTVIDSYETITLYAIVPLNAALQDLCRY